MLHKIKQTYLYQLTRYYAKLFLKKEYSFVSLKDYSAQNKDRVEYIYNSPVTFKCVRSDDKLVKKINENGIRTHEYVVRIKGASCFAFSDIILLDNNRLYSEIKNLEPIAKYVDCSDGYVLTKDEKYYHCTSIPTSVESIEKGVFLSGIFSWNYYHYTLEILPRMRLLSKIPKDVPLLVDVKCLEIPSYRDLLRICNTENRNIIYLKSRIRYEVNQLYLISTPLILPPNVRSGIPINNPIFLAQYNVEALRHIRDLVLTNHSGNKYDTPKRVFISRKNASGRRPFNEEDCIAVLKPLGFEVIHIEEFPFAKQVALFRDAEFIIGGSGAAFTNLLYCSKDCKIINFVGYNNHDTLWQTIAAMNECLFFDLSDKMITNPPTKDTLHNAFHIDPIDLSNLVTKMDKLK